MYTTGMPGHASSALPGYTVGNKAAIPAEGEVTEGHGPIGTEIVGVEQDSGRRVRRQLGVDDTLRLQPCVAAVIPPDTQQRHLVPRAFAVMHQETINPSLSCCRGSFHGQ